jgi:molybdate transport system substrate-binding protein
MRKRLSCRCKWGSNMRSISRFAAAMAAFLFAGPVNAAELKVLSAGAYKAIVLSIKPDFEKRTGHTLVVDNGTAGQLTKRIQDGEAFDLVILPPVSLETLAKSGHVAPVPPTPLARVGVGVMVPEGATKPDISTVDAFKAAVLAADTVAYIDPASGGSSGTYVRGLFEKLGIAEAIKSRVRLKSGGYVADLLASGEAKLGIHQISEIVGAKGVTLVGPLPAEIQSYTYYSGSISTAAKDPAAVQTLLDALHVKHTGAAIKARGMEPDDTIRFGATKF